MNKSLRAQVALAELEAMGLTVDDLAVAAGRDRSAPPPKRTVAEYLPVVAAGYKPRTRRTYNSYWILMVELIGDRPLDQVTVEDLLAVADEAERRAKQRRVGSDGRASRGELRGRRPSGLHPGAQGRARHCQSSATRREATPPPQPSSRTHERRTRRRVGRRHRDDEGP